MRCFKMLDSSNLLAIGRHTYDGTTVWTESTTSLLLVADTVIVSVDDFLRTGNVRLISKRTDPLDRAFTFSPCESLRC